MSSSGPLGFGAAPFGFVPLGGIVTTPVPAQATNVVAWLITIDGSYAMATDGSGNVAGMDGTDQRVQLIVRNSRIDFDIITEQNLNAQKQAWLNALGALVTEGAISGLSVTMGDDGNETTLGFVKYTNLGTSKAMTLPVMR